MIVAAALSRKLQTAATSSCSAGVLPNSISLQRSTTTPGTSLVSNPYTVLLAGSTAPAGVQKIMATSTGPKMSPCATVLPGLTPVSSVGFHTSSFPATKFWAASTPHLVPRLDIAQNPLTLTFIGNRAQIFSSI